MTNEAANQVFEVLRSVLFAHLHQTQLEMSDRDRRLLCEQVGVWPLPSTSSACLRALEVFAARVLALQFDVAQFGGASENQHANFKRWMHAVGVGDAKTARECARFLNVWSRGDSISLR